MKFSYDGTPTGQNKIITALNAMGRNSPEYVDLESYRVKARSYYVAQKDKFKQMEQFRAMRQESLKRREAQNATASNNSPV